MKAVIPCAKKKEALFPFSETKPTALMPVMGKPIIEHLMESLRETGVDEFYIVTNHLEESFREKFGEDSRVNIVHQEKLSGTASAIEECGDLEEEFFVVNGDVITSQEDLENLKTKFDNTNSKVSMLAAGEDKPEKFGVLSITNDQVTDLEEKPEEPENSLVNTGIYLFKPEITDIIGSMDSEEKYLTDAVKRFVEEEAATFELIENYWVDIGTPKRLLKADSVKREFEINGENIAKSAEVDQSTEIIGNVHIGEKSVVKAGAVLEGDVYIGEGVEVEPNTHIKNSTVCDSSVVSSSSVKTSLLFEDSILDPSTVIERTITGEESDVRGGTVIRESFIGARSYVEMNNSIRGVKFVPDARTDLNEISK